MDQFLGKQSDAAHNQSPYGACQKCVTLFAIPLENCAGSFSVAAAAIEILRQTERDIHIL
jgi:hypothetical protein